MPVNLSGYSPIADAELHELLELLKGIGISLPGDTSRKTFARDLLTAAKTVKAMREKEAERQQAAKNGGNPDLPAEDEKGPVQFSTESEMLSERGMRLQAELDEKRKNPHLFYR